MSSGLKKYSVEQLVAEIRVREEKVLLDLEKKQAALLKEAQEISKQIKAFTIAKDVKNIPLLSLKAETEEATSNEVEEKHARVNVRPEVSLKSRIKEVLKDGPKSLKDILIALEASGWTTTSANPYTLISAIFTYSGEFTRVSRGVYANKVVESVVEEAV